MQNKIVLALLMTALITTSAFAQYIKVDGEAPIVKAAPGSSFTQTQIDDINTAFRTSFTTALNGLNNELKDIKAKPEEFIKAWGDAGIFASHGATQRAYGGYKTFAVTVGPMVGLRLPGSPFTIMDDLDNLTDKLKEEQDIKLGFNPQMLNVNVGINTSKFLLKDLYLGLHFGFMKVDTPIEGSPFSFSNFSLGVTANYQLVAPKTLAKGLLVWRGVNVGSGFIYQGTKISYGLGLEPFKGGDFTSQGISGKIIIDPTLTLDMNINTFVIPIEVTTAVRLLWFLNIPLGVGVDLGFGKSDIRVGMKGDIYPEYSTSAGDLVTDIPGYLSLSAGGDMPPSFFNFKIMTGVGLNFGPVIIDIPVTLYLDDGYSVGVSVGFIW